MIYADENHNRFSGGTTVNWARGEWIVALQAHYRRKPELLLCPEATLQRGPGTFEVRVSVGDPRAVEYGGPTTAYEFPIIDPTVLRANQSLIASYGINNWVYEPPPGVTQIQGRNTRPG